MCTGSPLQIIAALDARGFSLHEVSRASQQRKQLGVWFDGVARVLRHDPSRPWRVHLALRCLPRMGGAQPRVVRVLTGHLVHIFSLARPLLSVLHQPFRLQAHPLDRWRRFSRADLAELRTLAGVVWLSECELGGQFSHVVFCSDATLRRYCVQCTMASLEGLKEATRFRERWRFQTQEISHTLSVRHANAVARLCALMEVILATTPRNKMVLALSRTLAELRVSKRSRIGTVPCSTAKACALAGLLCELPAPKLRRLKSA